VTGAGHGLGKNHALHFARLGAKVVVNDLGVASSGEATASPAEDSPADQLVALIRAEGGEACASYDSVVHGARIIEQALDHFGRVDVLVNNAGIIRDKSFHKMTVEDWHMVQDVHLNGAFALCHAAWPHLRTQRYGRIIFTLSAAGLYGNFGQANYSAAKMGMLGLMNSLAIEGQSRNIHANAIAPMVDSRMLEAFLPEGIRKQLSPDRVSPLVAYLCHEDCSENGSVFEVGGGWLGKLRWQRADGVFVPPTQTMDEGLLQQHWAQVCDFEQAHYPADNAEAVSYILQKLVDG
jgi:3-hydroxyacyl-CoA dehydrogenase/3a,7a,12a-trihydroxy-5b-cholest-24-enoyl-CoA hydratase